MELYNDYQIMPIQTDGSVVTIGSFDGLHLGHQYLLNRVLELSQKDPKKKATVVTFEPHPAKLLAPHFSPLLLMPPDRKIKGLQNWGLELVINQRFDEEFASLAPEEFVKKVLFEKLHAKQVVVGDDFSFGAKRQGLVENLVEWGNKYHMQVEVVRRRLIEGMNASSTRIRSFLLEGRVKAAALLLGRPYLVYGEVVRGLARGRTLGFPTVNVLSDAEILPAHGVYACYFWNSFSEKPLYGVVNVGIRPTFGNRDLGVEVHVFSKLPDLTGQKVALTFLERLREEIRFPSKEALVQQIEKDIEQAKSLESSHANQQKFHLLDGVVNSI